MILSICPTTTIERNWVIPDFSIGGFYRVQQESLFASGKGVNVARVIKNLNGQVLCAGFVGGYTGKLFQSLADQEGLQGSWTESTHEMRESITVYDPQSRQDATSFCPYGPTIYEPEWDHFVADLVRLAENVENLSISGNIPPGIKAEQFYSLVKGLGERRKNVWLDVSGEMLRSGISANPFAVKVNAKEISELANQPVHDKTEAIGVSKAIRKTYGLAIVGVTLGPEGAVCSSTWGDFSIHPIYFPRVTSSIGCGDAFLGAMLTKFEEGYPMEACLKAAAAAAGANTQKLGPGNFEIQDYYQALERAVLESVV
jgi:1-phosphofructokinase family hexose kinase